MTVGNSPGAGPASTPRSRRRVLIGFADSVAAIESAWSLLDAGFSVSAFARAGSPPPLRRLRSVELLPITPPECDTQGAIRDLREVMSFTQAQALMPLDDAAVWMSREACEGAALVLVGPSGPQAEVALKKQLQCVAATEAGFAVPDTQFFEAPAQPTRIAQYPLVVKPAVAAEERAGQLVVAGAALTCGDRTELDRAIAAAPTGCRLMVQRRLRGIGEGVFGVATPAGFAAWSAHRRIRMMNPAGSGSSACAPIPLQDSVREKAERMLMGLDWSGLFMLELLRDGEGKPWFIELNGRAWGSMALSRAVGLEYPAWAVSQALGDRMLRLPLSAEGTGVRARHLGREMVHLLAVLRGPKSSGVPWPSRAGTVRDVLSWHRGDRPYNWRPGELAVLLDDTVSTVSAAVRRKRPSAI